MKTPLVSVLMPVYNTKQYVKQAIESILQQSYGNFEFLIYDDASTDGSLDLIREYKDTRIKLTTYSKNAGYVRSLNNGIVKAKGDYIARMDADDISYPDRLAKQVKFLENNQDYGLLGGWCKSIPNGEILKLLTNDEDIRIAMLMNTCFAHPSVMYRAKLIKDNLIQYKETLAPAEDYYFFYEISKYSKLKNLSEVLIQYRYHEAQTSVYRKREQLQNVKVINELIIKDQVPSISKLELDVYIKFISSTLTLTQNYPFLLNNTLNHIINTNTTTRFFNEQKLSLYLSHHWNRNFLNAPNYNIQLLKDYLHGEFPYKSSIASFEKYKFWIKCLLNYRRFQV